MSRMAKKTIKIVTIGGGGGHAQILKGLKTLPHIKITAICPVSDSGGSTGALVEDYRKIGAAGFLGDGTKCLCALARKEKFSKALMNRFEHGICSGHSVKNLLFCGLLLEHSALDTFSLMGELLETYPHRVLPVSLQHTTLKVRVGQGHIVSGETFIDNMARNPLWHPDLHPITKVWLSPAVKVLPQSRKAILEADYIITCPGDLYTSILPVLLVDGMKQAIKKSRAKIISFVNIMTKQGETDGYTLDDILKKIEAHAGKPVYRVIFNSKKIPRQVMQSYQKKERKTVVSLGKQKHEKRLILADVLGFDQEKRIIHNSEKSAQVLKKIFR